MVVMELCLASRFSLYLCVSVYTECLYTHMIMLLCTALFRKKIPIFQFPSYFVVYFGNATLLSFYEARGIPVLSILMITINFNTSVHLPFFDQCQKNELKFYFVS